jgi:hypothetical protein
MRMPNLRPPRGDRGVTWTLAVLVALGLLAWVLVPVVLLHPFRAQSAFGVGVAYELRRGAPLATLLGLVLLLPLLVRLGGRAARWHWLPLGVLALVAAGSAWFARQNHFEWMFRPVVGPAYAKAAEAGFVADADMVIAIEVRGDAVAYPVRQMAYHHLVNDVAGGEPVVSTY